MTIRMKVSVKARIRQRAVTGKTKKPTQSRVKLAAAMVEKEAKESILKGGGAAGPPQIKEVQYFYADPKNEWVRASKGGEPPLNQTDGLRESIQTEKIAGFVYIVGPAAPYGKYLEFGTKNMRPRPFMRPALKRVIKKMPQLFRRLF